MATGAGAPAVNLHDQFGDIDIYLFDQFLRGRIRPGVRVLDAGCGGGRNLIYLLQNGYEVFATDVDPAAVRRVQGIAASLAPALPGSNIVVAPVERMPFPDAFADVVLSSAVLHFARDDVQFDAMVGEMWRVLKPGAYCGAGWRRRSGLPNESGRSHTDGRCCRTAASAIWWTRPCWST